MPFGGDALVGLGRAADLARAAHAAGLGLEPVQLLLRLDGPEGLVQIAGGQGADVAVELAVDVAGLDLADLLVADRVEADAPLDHVAVDGADGGFGEHGGFLRIFVAG